MLVQHRVLRIDLKAQCSLLTFLIPKHINVTAQKSDENQNSKKKKRSTVEFLSELFLNKEYEKKAPYLKADIHMSRVWLC